MQAPKEEKETNLKRAGQLISTITLLLVSLSGYANGLTTPGTLETALTQIESRDFPAALETIKQLDSRTDRLFYEAIAQHRSGDNNKAQATLSKLFAAEPGHVEGHYLLGMVHLALVEEVNIFKKISTAKKALGAWEKVTELDPSFTGGFYAVFSFYANAPGIAGGDIEQAKTYIPVIDKLDPVYGTLAKAVVLNKEENFSEAETLFKKAAGMTQAAGPQFALSQFYMQQENWMPALQAINRYEALDAFWWDPDISITHLIKARANAEMGNTDIARRHAERALELEPNGNIKGLLEELLEELG